jgi:Putative beta barrel porin-7 (BBP7)
MAAPAGGMLGNNMMSSSAPGACGCNAANYGAGDYYTSPGCGCGATGGYPNCGVTNYCDSGCNDNQWFGGIYFLEMGRTNGTPVKLTSQVPTGSSYPYYPTANDTVMTSRDVNFDFREGVEVRVGSTFTIGDSCSACQSTCGYNTGCGCNSCTPKTTYAWEFAWWGLNDSPNTQTVEYDGTNRLVGMKSYAGLQYNGNPVNGYYGYGIPVQAGPADPQILAQRVRTDFKAQNLELNLIRFPMCNTGCSTSSCGCNSCGGGDACGSNGGCADSCGLGFSMYGSCGVRYFHVDDDFSYDVEFNPGGAHTTFDGFGSGDAYELFHNIDVKNNLIGPQVGWTSDICWGKWNLFCNSTFGIFDNHMSVHQRMLDGTGAYADTGDGQTYNLHSNKDAVAFLGELRVGTAYDISCHWRAVVAYRAVAITGLATASDQLQNDYSDRYSAGIIDSDNAVIIHGAQIGAECRY